MVDRIGGARPLRHNPATVPPAISESQRSLALTLVRAGGSLLTARVTPESGPAAVLSAVVRRVAAMKYLQARDRVPGTDAIAVPRERSSARARGAEHRDRGPGDAEQQEAARERVP